MDSWTSWVLVVIALLVLLYTRNASRKIVDAPPQSPHPAAAMAAAAPAPRRDFVEAELAQFKGEGGRPIYVAADGLVFNMSSHEGGPAFYGPGGGYHVFAGRCVR